MDTSCCWGGDLSAVRRGKVAVVGGGVCRVPVNGASRACVWLPHDPSWIGCVRQRPGLQRVPHVNPLFRTWAVCSVRGRGCPGSG